MQQTLIYTLDWLFFSPLLKDESLENRVETIEALLRSHHTTWDNIINNLLNQQDN